jgi:dynein heavy chain
MDTPEVVRCTQMLNLMTSVLQEYQDANDQVEIDLFEKVWTYAFAWGIGGLFETDERIKFHREILERVGAPLPAIAKKTQGDQETVFEYFVDPATKAWKPWQVPAWDKPKKLVFSQLLIPTPDSTRAEYIIDKMASLRDLRSEIRKETGCQSTLLCGGSGTAKTSIILMNSFKFGPQKAFKRINFSFYTLPVNFQESIEAEVEKKGREYKPLGDKRLCIFMDDVSMPQINTWGDQITLEITRQLMDQKGFYFLDKEERGQFKAISGCYFLAAMMHPGGGRNDVPDRLKRQFFSINVPPPSTKAVESIYGQILSELLPSKKYSQDIVDMIPVIVEATIVMWETTYKKLLPTPTKFHYLFTIRELASVFGGIARVAGLHQYKVIQGASKLKEKMDPRLFLIGLWRHESLRTFQDKLATSEDRKTYQDILDKATKEKFRDSTGFEDEQLMTDLLFADYQRDDIYNEFDELEAEAPWVYEAVPSIESIKERSNERMLQFNEKYPAKKLDLVIFNDALFHLLKITRVLNAPSGNCMLVGVGGSGKQSLTKLGAFIAHKLIPFQLTVTKSYNLTNLLEDLKLQYLVAGPQGGKATFLMTDAEIKNETFLEALNSMLATGEIPGLHGKEDKDVIPVTIKPLYIKEAGSKGEEPSTATLWNFYINRVKDNLHTVLAFSPVGSKFRERAQKFPSLFSSCTIDWFLPWPEEALIDVSTKFLQRSEIECTPEVKNQLMVHMGKVHVIVNQTCADYLQQMRRYVYVTPKSYLSFINSYTDLYTMKFKAIDKEEYEINQGLNKLAEATTDIEKMSIDLAKEQKEVAEATENTNKLLKELDVENKKADIRAKEVDAVTEACLAQTAQIDLEKEEANRDLQAALPYLKQAEKAVDSIKSQDIAELKQNRNPNAINRMILDTVQLLFMRPLLPVSFKVVNVSKKDRNFIADSFDLTVSLYTGTEKGTLLQHLYYFSEHEKDIINPETIELLDPYIVGFVDEDSNTTLFDPAIAKATSGALQGLCTWARAMRDYHLASKIVQPKLKMLNEKTLDLERARKELAAAQSDLDAVNALKERLRVAFEEKQAAKQELETKAAKTKKRMEQANRLINSLDDNKVRWIEKRNVFKQTKKELIGNVAKACAFVSYCGPFNSEFRRKLADVNFQQDL